MRLRLIWALTAVCAGLLVAPALAPAYSGLRVRGNRLMFGPGRGKTVQLRGVSRAGSEYACIGGYGFFDSPDPNQIDTPAMIRAMVSWDINVVRVPLNEDCWLGVNTPAGRGGTPYRRIIERYVRALEAAHLFVVLDLHWAAPGSVQATRQLPMADADHSPAFWQSVGGAFRHDPDVIFDLYNEPYGISWDCWRDGCEVPANGSAPAYEAAGMQQLVHAVRASGSRAPLLLGGLSYALDLSEWRAFAPHDPLHELMASEHNYGDLSPCDSECLSAVAYVHRRVPVVFGELGETDCADGYIDSIMHWADANGIGYLGWAWNATDSGWSCSGGPSLITSYAGTPTAYGIGFQQHFVSLGVPVRP